MNDIAKQNAISTGIAGLVMCLYGFLMGGFSVAMDLGKTYEATIYLFNGMLKVGGLGLIVVAAIGYLSSWRGSLILDFIMNGLCGVIMVSCAACWIVYEKSIGLQNLLILVFGLLFLRAAFGSWKLFQPAEETETALAEEDQPPVGFLGIKPLKPPSTTDASQTDPIHPASLHPDSLPKEGEPPPDGGYLAALSKEEQEPPKASYE